MLRYLFVLFFMIINVTLYSQSLKLDRVIHNFGTINEKDGVVECQFEVANVSSKPFVIAYITTGCGCTGVDYNKAPIKPNETRKLTVGFDPKGRSGIFRTVINLIGASPKEDYEMSIIGNVDPVPETLNNLYPVILSKGARIADERIIFGLIPNKEEHINFIPLYNGSDKELDLRVEFGNKEFGKAWFTKPILKPKQSSYLMYRFNLKDSEFLGDLSDKLTIYIDGVKQQSTINVVATVLPNFMSMTSKEIDMSPVAQFDADFHNLGSIKEKETWSFEIENSGEGELKILKIIKKSVKVDVEPDFISLKRGEKGKIKLTLSSSDFEGAINARVTLIMNSPHTPIKTLTLSANKN